MKCLTSLAITMVASIFLQTSAFAIDQMPVLITDSEPPQLTSSLVEMQIDGAIADVRVHQIYMNSNEQPAQARYRFPKSYAAAIHGLTMRVGEYEIVAEIRRKEQARAEYQHAVDAGKTAVLMEQVGDDWVEVQLGNLPPGEVVDVTLRYTEVVMPESGIYRLAYPIPDNRSDFEILGQLMVPLTLQSLGSKTHAVTMEQGPNGGQFMLSAGDAHPGPFVIEYQLEGAAPAAGVMTTTVPGDGSYFMLMMEPPRLAAIEQFVPREYLFILDVSGSMHGLPIERAKLMMQRLLLSLDERDSFNILQFSGGAQTYAPESVRATPDEVTSAMDWVDDADAAGGTWLASALESILSTPSRSGHVRTAVVMTDGYIRVAQDTMEQAQRALGDTNLFAFGVAANVGGVNRRTIRQLARMGQTRAYIVESDEQAIAAAESLVDSLANPAMTDITLAVEGFQSTSGIPARLPDLFAHEPLLLTGRLPAGESGYLKVTGNVAGGLWEQEFELNPIAAAEEDVAIAVLWARQQVAALEDWVAVSGDEAAAESITELGLQFSLLTDYTSFVGVSNEVITEADAFIGGGTGLSLPAIELPLESVAASISANVMPVSEPQHLVIIAGDESDDYYAAALRFHAQRPGVDLHSGIGSIQEIRDILDHSPYLYQSIELVVHGWEWTGLDLTMTPGGARVSLAALEQLTQSRPLSVSGQTTLRFDSCGIGNRPELVMALAGHLGINDQSRISAAIGVVHYRTFSIDGKVTTIRSESPYEAFLLPPHTSPDAVAEALKARFGGSLQRWKSIVADMHSGSSGKLLPLQISMPVFRDDLKQFDSITAYLSRHRGLRQQLKNMGLEQSELVWRTRQLDQKQDRVYGEALAVIVYQQQQKIEAQP